MAKVVSFTIHPSPLTGEYLTVSDALRQVLDLVESLEKIEDENADARKIVWRLVEAHTSSPPFTVIVEPTAAEPTLSIALAAEQVYLTFSRGMDSLLQGQTPDPLPTGATASILRALKRNLNGVSETGIAIEGQETKSIVPSNARAAVVALERVNLEKLAASPNYQRTEFGTIEGELIGLTKWYGKQAIIILERLSETKVTCVLNESLVDQLGPEHFWAEVWDGRRLLVGGALYFDNRGLISRVDATYVHDLLWTDVNIKDIQNIDILNGHSPSEHLSALWVEEDVKAD